MKLRDTLGAKITGHYMLLMQILSVYSYSKCDEELSICLQAYVCVCVCVCVCAHAGLRVGACAFKGEDSDVRFWSMWALMPIKFYLREFGFSVPCTAPRVLLGPPTAP